MDHSKFKQAKNFIFTDIHREIRLAYASSSKADNTLLERMGIPTGGRNFLAALALLSYTEFGGKLKCQRKKEKGCDHASKNFNQFFDDLGTEYKNFRAAGNNVYDIFRCGLVHEYYAKNNCTIFMLSNENSVGIGKNPGGEYWFVIEHIFC